MEFKANKYQPNEVFKFIRQCAGVTQKELAEKMNKSIYWVKKNEEDVTRFYFEDLIKMADLYDIEVIIRKK